MAEPNFDDINFDETDRRLIGALNRVEVPAGLHARLQRSLQVAAQEFEQPSVDAAVPQLTTHSAPQSAIATPAQTETSKRPSVLWNRRTAIAAVVAAGLGGTMFGYRHFTQPLSQAWLVKSAQSLLAQVQHAQWQPLDESEVVAVKRSLLDLGFLRYVQGVSFDGSCELRPPRDVQVARAYDLGSELVLLDLQIERGVQGVHGTLNELAWTRSDSAAFAMSSGNRTLVFTGPAAIRSHILRARTT